MNLKKLYNEVGRICQDIATTREPDPNYHLSSAFQLIDSLNILKVFEGISKSTYTCLTDKVLTSYAERYGYTPLYFTNCSKYKYKYPIWI